MIENVSKDAVGGTLVVCIENGTTTVAVRVEKDGKPVAQAQVEGLTAAQGRAVLALASLWRVTLSEPDCFDKNLAGWYQF